MRVLIPFQLLGKKRHEGHVECALGKEAAKQIWQGKRGKEGIRNWPGPQESRDHQITCKPQDPRQHRPQADRKEPGQKSDRLHDAALLTPCTMASSRWASNRASLLFWVNFSPVISFT